MITVDGLDARFLKESTVRVKAPTIRRLMRTGASAGVIGVAPSDTPSSLTAILTGQPPYEHSGNVFWRQAPHDVRAASVYWLTPPGVDLTFDFPPLSPKPSSASVPFSSVAARCTPAGIVDRIELTYPSFEKQVWDDSSVAQAASWILANDAPDVLLVELTDLATEERQTPGFSVYARNTLDNEDDLIAQILAKAPKEEIVVIVSGRGVENENYVVRPRVLLKSTRGTNAIEVADGLIGTTDPALAARLRALMASGPRHGIAREVPMSEVRAKAPDLGKWIAAFDTPTNYVASAENRGPGIGPGSHLGVGGLWPTRPDYRSIFVIAGEGIQARRLGDIDILQIAPTLADAIGARLNDPRKPSLWQSISQ